MRRTRKASELTKLAERLVSGDSRRSREIQGAQLGVCLRDGDALFTDLLVEPVGSALALVAEDQTVAIGIPGIPVGLFRPGGEEPEAVRTVGAGLEGFPVLMMVATGRES